MLERPGSKRISRPAFMVRRERFGWAMVSPAMIFLIVMAALPLVSIIIMSTFRIDLSSPLDNGWIGLDNYRDILHDSRFWHSMWVTFVYTVSTVILQVTIGLVLATAFFRSFKGQGILRVCVLLPTILAPVVVGLSFRTMIMSQQYGILDYASILFGFGSQPWLTDRYFALISVIIIHTWQWTPFAFLVFLASLHSMPLEPIEAALLDTRSTWQRFRHVILPMIRPAIVIVIIFRTTVALRAFAAIFSATGGGPGTATEILNLYAYRESFDSLNLGYGASLGTVLLVITVVISLIFFRLRRSKA